MALTKRQYQILDFIHENQQVKRIEIEEFIRSIEAVSKITILRDLEVLINNRYVKKLGDARSTVYLAIETNDLLRKINVEEYFKTEIDKRKIKYEGFNFGIFENLKNIFSEMEIKELKQINQIFIKKIHRLTPQMLKKEFERLMIELSWKSSQIEGNTYSLLDTEILIKDNIEAKGHRKEEAIMILNHKKALEYVFNNREHFKMVSMAKIEELHSILTDNLGVRKGLRKSPVGIVGTNYKPLDNVHQIREAVEKLVKTINDTDNPIEKALVTVLMISYIQPFEDGNKRCGRILANAILHANNYCPLSYRSIDEVEYKKAVVIFYENNSLNYFKELFKSQFKFAVEKYF